MKWAYGIMAIFWAGFTIWEVIGQIQAGALNGTRLAGEVALFAIFSHMAWDKHPKD